MYFCRELAELNHLIKGSEKGLFRRAMLGVLVAAIFSLSILCLTIAPQRADIVRLRSEAQSLEKSPWLGAQIEDYSEDFSRIKGSPKKGERSPMIGSSDMLENTIFLESIAQEAKRSGMTIRSFTPMTERRSHAYLCKPVGLVIEGEYARLLQFLKRLTMISPMLGIDEIVVQDGHKTPSSDSSGQRPLLTVSMIASIYQFLPISDTRIHRSKPPDPSEV